MGTPRASRILRSALALRSIVEYMWRHLNSESKPDTFTGQKSHPGSQSPIEEAPVELFISRDLGSTHSKRIVMKTGMR